MTERISLKEYRQQIGLDKPSLPTKKAKRDNRWHFELARHIHFHPAIDKSDFEAEFVFHPDRKFRFDFAFIDRKVAVEVQGIIKDKDRDKGEKSAHQTFTGVTRDCEKQSLAATLGWRVLPVTQEQIKSGKAIEWIVAALKFRQKQ